jgi:signal transduction histidine kinase
MNPAANPSQRSPPRLLGDLSGFQAALDLSTRTKVLAELLASEPGLPGAILTANGALHGAVSRRYYLDMVGRYCGMDLYHPRPIRLMMERFEHLGGALVLPANLPVPAAVQRGLARPRELVYEPVVVAGEAADGFPRLVDFEDLLVADARLSALRSDQMRQILGTVREGLLIIDHEQRIAPEYADAVEAIFGTADIAGRRFEDLLDEVLDRERCELARDYVASLFNPAVIESLVATINPLAKVEATLPGGRKKVIEVRFARGYEGRAIRHVLVRVEDVTRREELARELASQQERAEQRLTLALAMVQSAPDSLGAFLEQLRRAMPRATASLLDAGIGPGANGDPGPAAAAALAELARMLHGLKGEAGMLGLAPLSLALHGLESALAPPVDAARALAGLAQVDSLSAEADALIDQLGKLGRARPPASHPPAASRLAPATTTNPETPLAGELAGLAATVADDVGKQVRFALAQSAAAVPAPYRRLVREVAIQLVRNAVVHGLEAPALRRTRGKPALGTVQLALNRHGDDGSNGSLFELVVQDDGGGLDLPRLRAKASTLGVAATSPEELSELIFRPGFSTATQVDLHAGRGVGLDLVRSSVEAVGGRVVVHSQPGRFCAFQVVLPLPAASGVRAVAPPQLSAGSDP